MDFFCCKVSCMLFSVLRIAVLGKRSFYHMFFIGKRNFYLFKISFLLILIA